MPFYKIVRLLFPIVFIKNPFVIKQNPTSLIPAIWWRGVDAVDNKVAKRMNPISLEKKLCPAMQEAGLVDDVCWLTVYTISFAKSKANKLWPALPHSPQNKSRLLGKIADGSFESRTGEETCSGEGGLPAKFWCCSSRRWGIKKLVALSAFKRWVLPCSIINIIKNQTVVEYFPFIPFKLYRKLTKKLGYQSLFFFLLHRNFNIITLALLNIRFALKSAILI